MNGGDAEVGLGAERSSAWLTLMSDTLGRICFSNAPFRWVKRVFFHRWVLWPVGSALTVGLSLTLIGMAVDQIGCVVVGLLLAFPFVLWTSLLAVVSFILAVPRFVVLSVSLAAVYLGLPGVSTRVARWAAKYAEPSNSCQSLS